MTKEKILLSVDYTDDTKKFWNDSYIKNKVFTIDKEKDLHDQIAEIIAENDYMTLCYKNRPQSNVFIDRGSEAIPIGYIYRGKTEIENKKALFDVWVTIKAVSDYKIKEIN